MRIIQRDRLHPNVISSRGFRVCSRSTWKRCRTVEWIRLSFGAFTINLGFIIALLWHVLNIEQGYLLPWMRALLARFPFLSLSLSLLPFFFYGNDNSHSRVKWSLLNNSKRQEGRKIVVTVKSNRKRSPVWFLDSSISCFRSVQLEWFDD